MSGETGGVGDPTPALTDAERRTITGTIQRTLRDGETGMDDGDCNRAEWHVAAALAPVVASIKADAVAAALAPVERLADEWAEEGSSLVRNAYSGGDVFEGQTLERCARNLRAALAEAKRSLQAAAAEERNKREKRTTHHHDAPEPDQEASK